MRYIYLCFAAMGTRAVINHKSIIFNRKSFCFILVDCLCVVCVDLLRNIIFLFLNYLIT